MFCTFYKKISEEIERVVNEDIEDFPNVNDAGHCGEINSRIAFTL